MPAIEVGQLRLQHGFVFNRGRLKVDSCLTCISENTQFLECCCCFALLTGFRGHYQGLQDRLLYVLIALVDEDVAALQYKALVERQRYAHASFLQCPIPLTP